jgi:replication factor A1
MSVSIDELYQMILDSGVSEKELEKQVRHKENEFGGFMSKQGILFIIAKEYGIYVQSSDTSENIHEDLEEELDYDEFLVKISELNEEMNQFVILGKILMVYEPKNFTRKDGSVGKVGSFLIGDGSQKIKVILWDEKTDILNSEFFNAGEIVRIIGAYCKKNRNGNIEIHLRKRSKINFSPKINDNKLKMLLKSIDLETPKEQGLLSSSSIKNQIERYNYIRRIQGKIHIEKFKEITKKTGGKTFLLKLLLRDDSLTVRVLIWGLKAIELLKIINNGDRVLISNLAVKKNKFHNEKELVFTKNSTLEVIG